MATLDSLKWALRHKATAMGSSPKPPLSDTQYSTGFNILVRDSERIAYQDFIIPQLSQLLTPLFDSRAHISVLEIGPGPKSVLGYLPRRLRRKIRRYVAFEPNSLFATRVEDWLCSISETVIAAVSRKPTRYPSNPICSEQKHREWYWYKYA